MTVRQVFYQATVRGLVEKAESGYAKVQTDLTVMRRAGDLPYDWLADNTRWQRKPRTFDSVEDALQDTARFYRKALWNDADCYVEIWLEKDALAGVVYPITNMYDVPLMVARGYASALVPLQRGRVHQRASTSRPTSITAATSIRPVSTPGEKIEETLRELAPDAEIFFERIAVTPEQINEWDLPTRPTKDSDTRSKGFGAISVELDAIEPNQLRRSCKTRSSSICQRINSRCSRQPRNPSARSSHVWSIRPPSDERRGVRASHEYAPRGRFGLRTAGASSVSAHCLPERAGHAPRIP